LRRKQDKLEGFSVPSSLEEYDTAILSFRGLVQKYEIHVKV
jgi:hypothetical protein